MNAVLLGYGTIGKGVEILCQNIEEINLKQVFVRPSKVKKPYFDSDGIQMVSNPDVDIVFECLNGIEPANALITCALEHGKHVITSNKAVVSYNLERYIQLCKRYGGTIQIEACVAGGIPFLDAVLKLSQLEDLQGYEGIFNGTSNYILDQMQKHNLDFSIALKQAQELGYAEADPTNDIEGIDAFYKANITNMLAYHTKNTTMHAPYGISKISKCDIDFAKANQKVIRHLAISVQEGNTFSTIIAPCFLDSHHYLANVPDNYNAQLIHAHSFGQLGYFGQGAGQLATAQAMLANAIDTLQKRERKIVLNHQKEWIPDLLKPDWILRSNINLKEIFNVEPLKNHYYLVRNKSVAFIDQVLEADPDAMVAIWRDTQC